MTVVEITTDTVEVDDTASSDVFSPNPLDVSETCLPDIVAPTAPDVEQAGSSEVFFPDAAGDPYPVSDTPALSGRLFPTALQFFDAAKNFSVPVSPLDQGAEAKGPPLNRTRVI